MKSFNIPVVALGPGSQEAEDNLDYMVMPSGMATYAAPVLPEPEEMAARVEARKTIAWLDRVLQHYGTDMSELHSFDLASLDAANLDLLNQVLGEGEVSARVTGDVVCRIQESIFAGVWRVIWEQDGVPIRDVLQVCPIPPVIVEVNAGSGMRMGMPARFASDVVNAPAVLSEIAAHAIDPAARPTLSI
jgi:hydrogenase-1 operon protein HyaF